MCIRNFNFQTVLFISALLKKELVQVCMCYGTAKNGLSVHFFSDHTASLHATPFN